MESTQCLECHYYNMLLTCSAFPDGIPTKIATGVIEHNKPMLGQKNDFVFREYEEPEPITCKGYGDNQALGKKD